MRRVRQHLPFLASLVVLAPAWELTAKVGLVNPLILPAPSAIWNSLVNIAANFLGDSGYWVHAAVTLTEIVLGFVIGAGGALVLGALVGEFMLFRQIMQPYVVILNAAPKIAFAPLFIVWLGFGVEPKVAMAAFICAFPVYINTIAGMQSVDQEQLELVRSLQASKWQTFWRLKYPHSLPYIFASLKTAMVLAVIGAVVGEFTGAQQGLGYLIRLRASSLAADDVFALILILSLVGWGLFVLVELVERRVVFWISSDRAPALSRV